jgi:hypothetical protein
LVQKLESSVPVPTGTLFPRQERR